MTFNEKANSGTTYNHDICISLVNSGSRNGEYEPYEKHSYPLDNTVILRGVPKLIDGRPGWDGDRYLPDGTVERRYGIVDLGTLEWTKGSDSRLTVGSYFVSNKPVNVKVNFEFVQAKYEQFVVTPLTAIIANKGSGVDKIIWNVSNGENFYVIDSAYDNATAFKAAMSGVYLVYELAEPTTETADPYRELQIVDDWGTEEFVSESLVPVGHETSYPANLRDKLQHLPDLAASNGIYIVKQTDSEMELLKLPDMPTANGNYRLKLNVASGSPTFSWEVVT